MKDLELYLNRYGTGVNGWEPTNGVWHRYYIEDKLVKAVYENCKDDSMMTRVCNGLMRSGIVEMHKLIRTSVEDLEKIRNFGASAVNVLRCARGDNPSDTKELAYNSFVIKTRNNAVGDLKRIKEIFNDLGCIMPDTEKVQFCTPIDLHVLNTMKLQNRWILLYADLIKSPYFILVNYQSIATPFPEVLPRIAVVDGRHGAVISCTGPGWMSIDDLKTIDMLRQSIGCK